VSDEPDRNEVSGFDRGLAEVSERSRGYSPPKLRSRFVHLRALVPEDYGYLQLLETSGPIAPLWRLRGRTPSPQEWAQSQAAQVLAQFVIVSNKDGRRIGLVNAYQANHQDGHVQVAALQFDPESRSPLVLFGFGLFIEYLFRCWPFHKVYLYVAEYSYPRFASGIDRFFVLEGRLHEHLYLDGQRWDQLILAIYRSTWESHPKRFLYFGEAG